MADFDDVESVIDNPLAFAKKLGIDGDAFAALRLKKNLGKVLLLNDTESAEAIEEFAAEVEEEFGVEAKEELAALFGEEIGTELGKEIRAKFGKEVAREAGAEVASEVAAAVGNEIAGEAGAKIAIEAGSASAEASAEASAALKVGKKIAREVGGEIADEVGTMAGAMLASSSWVASTFFPAKGLLGFLGLATATTPVGWVIAASIGSGVLVSWGYKRLFREEEDDEVAAIPDCINTPLDVLAFRLFYFFAPFGLKVASADSTTEKVELEFIRNYFQHKMGFSREFIREGLIDIKKNVDDFDIVELTENLIEFKKDNPDFDYEVLSKELKTFLCGVMRSDGKVDARELDIVNAIVDEQRVQIREFWNNFL